MLKLSIVICVYNEKETILPVLDRVRRAPLLPGWHREIIVVDNASTDGTRELLCRTDAPDIRVIFQPQNLGKGTSIRTAIPYCDGDYVFIQDADFEYDPNDYPKFLTCVEERAPVAVFGSRTLGGRAIYQYVANYWGVRLLTALTNLLYGAQLTDVATASKMVRTDVLKSLRLTGSGFDLDFELPGKLLRAGYEIAEVPISYKPRTVAEGKKIRPWDGLWALRIIVRDRLLPMNQVIDERSV